MRNNRLAYPVLYTYTKKFDLRERLKLVQATN